MFQIILALLVILVVARLILRGYKAEPVLLLAGLLLMAATQLFGWGKILPSSVPSTGIAALDGFEVIRDLFSSRAAQLGMMIMALMGFAHYMDHIGANAAVVRVATKPLKNLRSPYALLFCSYLLASALQLAIPSATGLAVLLMGTMFPIMLGLGLSAGSAAGVIATSLAVAYTPSSSSNVPGISTPILSKVVLFQQNTLPVLLMGIVHIFWQRHCDRQEGFVPQPAAVSEGEKQGAPALYACLPMLPIVMAVGSSQLFVQGIRLDVTTIVLISMAICMLLELIRLRDAKQVCAGFDVFLKGMGQAFTGVVGLLVAAGVFAHGIKVCGAIDVLIELALHVGLPPFAMTVVFAIVTFAAAMVMGSGNAPFLAFVELIPQIASSMGANAVSMILPMQQASHMGRAVSPVSGVIIAVSSAAHLTPFAVVKRTMVPVVAGLMIHTIIIGVFY